MKRVGLVLSFLLPMALLLVSCESYKPPTGTENAISVGPAGEGSMNPEEPGLPRTTDQVFQFPITEFTDVQGTTQYMGWPYGDQIYWTRSYPDFPYAAWVDFAGTADGYLLANGIDLGTRITGTVTEQILNSGERKIHITLHATNALTLVNLAPEWPTIMGANGVEVVGGATTSLSNGHLNLTFRDSYGIGEPLPDLAATLLFGEPWEGLEFDMMGVQANGTGPLHEGSGWPEGTPGNLVVSQVGNFLPNWAAGPHGNGFACEVVRINAIGNY